MSEIELLFFEDQEQFSKLFSDLFIYDFEFLEILQNEHN